MDPLNKKAAEVLVKEGEKKFIEHVFTDPNDKERKLTYAEMRMLYGWKKKYTSKVNVVPNTLKNQRV